ncbi:Cyclin-dependent kinase 15 [Apodemus speciosus]|uniref:Cyclin-dependent kinase 15 n=1 Tax=Apodemus speciosus TaxID=105296 RepID=A0ABQ0EDS5_APOSI
MGQELCAKRLQPGCSCYHRSEGGEAHSCQRSQPGSTEPAVFEAHRSKEASCSTSSFHPRGLQAASAQKSESKRPRSNSDSFQEENMRQGLPWQKKSLPFGAASSYLNLEKLGEGSYAKVYKGISRINGQLVALKVISMNAEEGVPFTAIREELSSPAQHLAVTVKRVLQQVLLTDVLGRLEAPGAAMVTGSLVAMAVSSPEDTVPQHFQLVHYVRSPIRSCSRGLGEGKTDVLFEEDVILCALLTIESKALCTLASLLKGLKHANIVLLHDIVHTKETLTFVFEYMHTDLAQYMSQHPGGLHPHNVRPVLGLKLFMFQLLRGLAYIHQQRVLHRDLKPQNLLLSHLGELKLADFGLARAKSIPSQTYSSEVVTLWYRPPDALLGATEYSSELDIWLEERKVETLGMPLNVLYDKRRLPRKTFIQHKVSDVTPRTPRQLQKHAHNLSATCTGCIPSGAGCIFIEMFQGQPLFPGVSNILEQLEKIWEVLGVPTEDTWPGVSKLPNYNPEWFPPPKPQTLQIVWNRLGGVPEAEDLASQMLKGFPRDRVSAQDALVHDYFSALPSQLYQLPDESKRRGDMHMSGKRDGPFLIENTVLQKEAQRLDSGGREVPPPQASRPLETQVTLKPAFAARA